MVNSIGGASAAQATYSATPAAVPKTDTEQAATTTTTAAAGDAAENPSAPTQSAESAAATRLGDELKAQADATRVQRAAGGAGGSAASSETTDTDYIAEADTNADKTVSDEERAAYEARLRKETEMQAEVRAAYGQDEGAGPALDVTA